MYGIVNGTASNDVVVLAEQILAGGCRLLQLRHKNVSPDQLLREAVAIRQRCRAVDAVFFVNDDPHVAHRAGADGVHVGQLDLNAQDIREQYGRTLAIGVSHNTLEHLEHSLAIADYVAVGPAWPTPHLSYDKPVRGLSLVREARLRSPLPLVAIGGIRPERVPAVREAGADAWAVIRALCEADDVTAATQSFL